MLKMIQNYQIYQNYQNVAELIQNCVACCKWCLWGHGLFLEIGLEKRHYAPADGQAWFNQNIQQIKKKVVMSVQLKTLSSILLFPFGVMNFS